MDLVHLEGPRPFGVAGFMQNNMSRIVSFIVLLAFIVVIGALFYKVMIGFLVPVFLAAVLVVLFRPMHRWISRNVGEREYLRPLSQPPSSCSSFCSPLASSPPRLPFKELLLPRTSMRTISMSPSAGSDPTPSWKCPIGNRSTRSKPKSGTSKGKLQKGIRQNFTTSLKCLVVWSSD